MSDAFILEYLSARPNQVGLPHHHHHHHDHHHNNTPPATMPTFSSTSTPYTLHEPAPTRTTFGRGGAGNRTPSTPLPPSALPPPSDTHGRTPNYSTGRGGAGNMHAAGEERRVFSFDEELATTGGGVPVYHVGRGGRGNAVGEEVGRRVGGSSVGSGGSGGSGGEGKRGSWDWIPGVGRKA